MTNDDLDSGATLRGLVAGQHVFNRYVLTRILGRGGMGVVWLAQDSTLGRDVALKFLPEVVALDARAVDDMKRETRRSLELTHPNIVRIHDFIYDTRHAAISMEYVDGDSFSKKAMEKPERAFDVAEIAPIVQTLCEVLTYAHGKAKIAHRDLKPANLMLTKGGELKVADFGISATLSDTTSRTSTSAASSSGTPVYMSPQQMMGEKPAPTDDIYSLGATLYELLTGKPPFYSGNIMAQAQNKIPSTMTERRAELDVRNGAPIPASWEKTVAVCLAKNAKDRPQTAAEVWERLNGKVAPQAVRTPASPQEKDKRQTSESASSDTFDKKTVGILAAVVGVVIALIIGLAVGRNSELVPERETDSAPVSESTQEAQSSTVAQGYGTSNENAPTKGRNWTVPDYNIEMVWIAPGTFMMGSPSSESGRFDDETQHQVTLTKGYWLGKYEVTQGQWQAVMGTSVREQRDKANPSWNTFGEGRGYPMYYISWDEAQAFCKTLADKEYEAGRLPAGYEYSLPTEAQWEYACRAGTTTAYSWGNGFKQGVCNVENRAGSSENKNVSTFRSRGLPTDSTMPVGKFSPNAWGLYDMHGNEDEWCYDWYDDYPSGAVMDPTGPRSGKYRIARGSTWSASASTCRSANRGNCEPFNRIGFRLALRPVQ